MGFLTPALLALAAVAAVPIALHLLHRFRGRRIVFPALRYLQRAEKDHARRIRLRQWLLLAIRCAIVLLIAGAAARPFVTTTAGDHEPTAVVIILDNSLASAQIQDDRRLLDLFRDRALEALARAGDDDRFWLIRAGSPWEPALPGTAWETAARVRSTEPAPSAPDMGGALERARTLLAAGAEGRAREVHLLTALPATAIDGLELPARPDDPLVVVWNPGGEPPPNAAVTSVEVGGGVAPVAGQRASVAVRVDGERDGDSVAVRLVLDDRLAAAGVAVPGQETVLPFPARTAGLVAGWAEIDPDALRMDDRRYFVATIRSAPTVAAPAGEPFLDEALDVLEAAGRIVRAPAGSASVLVAPGGAGAGSAPAGRAVVVFAPADPVEVAAANRRLSEAGIPWRFGDPVAGVGAGFQEADTDLAGALERARIDRFYPLESAGEEAAKARLRLRDGTAWAVSGERTGGGQYVVIGSPLTPDASTLPTGPGLVPLLDRMLAVWAAPEPDRLDVAPGRAVPLPAGAEFVEAPDGERIPVIAETPFRAPAQAGVYRVIADGRPVAAFAVNAAPAASVLRRADGRALRSALPGWNVRVTNDVRAWQRAIFHVRPGREVWRPVLLLVLALLVLESLVAAAGRGRVRTGTGAGSEAAAASPPGPARPVRRAVAGGGD